MNLPIDQIDFTPSENPDEEQVKSIAESLSEIGQSHPLIVRPLNSSGRFALVSGERRLLAAKSLGWSEIKVEIRDISENDGEEIRLHENLKRFNLPWWDQVLLVEKLHLLRQAKHGQAKDGRPAKAVEKSGWSVRDTARELQVALGSISEDLNLARAVRNDPTLRNIKDKKTAIRLVRITAKRHQAEAEAGLSHEMEGDQVFLGDAAVILSQLPANSVHHAVTDPPWINFFDPSLTIDDRTLPVFRELYRVLKFGAFLYLFCGLDDYSYYAGVDEPHTKVGEPTEHKPGQLERIGFTISKTPLLWKKLNSMSRRGVASWEYDRDFEFIILAVKGTPALTTGTKLSSIKEHAIVHPTQMIHPNEKPIELIQDILEDCSYQNQIICDPFAGSGVLGEACIAMNRSYILIERDKKSYDNIIKRLEGE